MMSEVFVTVTGRNGRKFSLLSALEYFEWQTGADMSHREVSA